MSLYALKRLGLDQVWWLVSPQNPLKPTKNMAPLADRLAGARAIAGDSRIIATDIEAQIGTRYTVDTLAILRQRFSRTHFVWLMGADNLQQFPRWRHWPEIFATMPVAIFRRPGHSAGYRTGKAASRFAANWLPAAQALQLAAIKPPVWLVLDNPLNVTSATAIRQHR